MRKSLLLLLLVFVASLPVRVRADTTAAATPITISEVYGGGGNVEALYPNDYVELFNRTRQAVDLTGWTVGYSPKASSTWTSVPLQGTLNPYRYYLIRFGTAGGGGSKALPAPDSTSGTNVARTAGKIRVTSPSGVADLIGWGTGTNAYESKPEAAPTDNRHSLIRIGYGCTDTDRNDRDFRIGNPFPRNRAMNGVACGSAPVLAPIGSKTATANQALAFTVSATDADRDPLTYSASPLPSGARFTPSTRTFEWIPNAEQVGTHDLVFKVSDGTRTDSETVRITVKPDPYAGRSEITLEAATDFRRINASGTVVPRHQGSPITVKLFRYEPGGYRRIGLVRTTLDVNSSYRASFPRPSAGRCAVRATFHGDDDHPPATEQRELRC